MADETNKDEEPSIEEILSSIRDIISEEDEEGAAVPAEQETPAVAEDVVVAVENVVEDEPETEATPAEDDDVIELTDVAEDENDAVESVDTNEDDPLAGIDLGHSDDDLDVVDDNALDDILGVDDDAVDNAAIDDVFDSVDVEDEPVMEVAVVDEPPQEEGLVDKIAEVATVGAMAKLAENIAVSRTKEGVTLEDIVKESLKPMLKSWLDENLPTIIERLVSQELERLANKAAGK